MKNILIDLNRIGNTQNGYLSFFETNKEIPFDIKRVYYIYGTPNKSIRGKHAHKTLQQVLWCPHGIIEVELDNGNEKKTYILDSPNKILLVLKGYWHDMLWKKNESVLCIAASDYYHEEDYIRDYGDFIKYVKRGYWKNED
jgi:dTDP-4-dehydrorhamnose 3,5-epimerase-like enzyme